VRFKTLADDAAQVEQTVLGLRVDEVVTIRTKAALALT
jgi:hypothetical protein